jgi:hypothetical protein
MSEEAEDEIGTLAEASKTAIDPSAELADAGEQRIAQVLLDIAVAPLGIRIWGVGRKSMQLDLRRCLHLLFDHRRAMGVEPVPDNDEGGGNVLLEVAEGNHDVIAADGMCEVSLVDVTRPGQPDHSGKCTAFADAWQDQCLPLRSPCGPRLGPQGEAGLVDEHDLRLVAGLFLSGANHA